MDFILRAIIIIGLLTVCFVTPVYGQVTFPNRGGTGTSTPPTTGQVLVGCQNSQGQSVYCPRATSTLGFNLDTSNFLSLAAWFATTTDALDEGITNLYYSAARARAAITETITGIGYSSSTGVFSLDAGYVVPTSTREADQDTAFGWGNHAIQNYFDKDTDDTGDLTESGNLFFTTARVLAYLDTLAKGYFFSTTSANTWEAAQTARTADDLTNNTLSDLSDVAALSPSPGHVLTYSGGNWTSAATGTLGLPAGTVTSVGVAVPTGLTVSGVPITGSGTATIAYAAGYGLPLTASTSEWAQAYASTTALTNTFIRGLISEAVTGLDYADGVLSLTSGYVIPSSASTSEWAAAYLLRHAAVTLTGEDYLSLSIQQITANAIDPDNLSASDFGDFTCNGTTCAFDADTVAESELDLTAVTLADFTNDAGYITAAVTSLGGQTGATQTFASSSSGTDFRINSAADVHTFTVPSASASARGLLTAADWSTFNGKQDPVTAGDGLTLTGTDIDCDTATVSAFGCLASADWTLFNNKVSSTSIDTVGEIQNLVGGQNLILETEMDSGPELAALIDDETGTGVVVFNTAATLASTTLNGSTTMQNATATNFAVTSSFNLLGDAISNVGTWVDAKVEALTNVTAQGLWDFSSARLKQRVYRSMAWPPGPSMATTTTATTSVWLGDAIVSETWNAARCKSNAVNSVGFRITDGTNHMNFGLSTTTSGTTTLSTNNSFVGGEARYMEVGPMTNGNIACSFDITVN
jgi:hypothetical protein